MRLGSLFAGIGGFDLAAERAGLEIVWQSEIDKHASKVLEHRWPEVPNLGDIHNIRPGLEPDQHDTSTRNQPHSTSERSSSVSSRGLSHFGASNDTRTTPAVDVLTGGFPCQDYSVAGVRGGLAGDRGALWWEYHRLIDSIRPTWVLGENVPGLLSSNGGRDFETIVRSLTELGYGVAWAVLDAQYFGVAQRRRRVFIVGHSGGQPRPEILALSEGLFGHPEPSQEARTPVAALTANGLGGGGPDDNLAQAGHLIAFAANQRDEVRDLDDKAGALAAEPGMKQQTFVANKTTVRRLTPLECERLQGFPDNWTNVEGVSMTQRYRQLGNAVAVPVVEWIMKRIAGQT